MGIGHRVAVCLTVDVETSIGGAFRDSSLHPVGYEKRVYGIFKRRALGIPLMMAIAEEHGLRLTFFVETLGRLAFGIEPLQEVVRNIIQRGHDIQLHLHPSYRTFLRPKPWHPPESDFMRAYSIVQQVGMLEDGVRTLRECGAPRVIAFRAGCFGANETTLQALHTVGLLVDSSYNAARIGDECGFQSISINDVWRWGTGVYELPITCFYDRSLGRKKLRALDINGTSFGEIKSVLNSAYSAAARCVVVLLHSFSFIKAYDNQYTSLRVRSNVIQRFRRLCAFLEQNQDKFEVRTVGEWTLPELDQATKNVTHRISQVSPVHSWGRLIEQAWDRWI